MARAPPQRGSSIVDWQHHRGLWAPKITILTAA